VEVVEEEVTLVNMACLLFQAKAVQLKAEEEAEEAVVVVEEVMLLVEKMTDAALRTMTSQTVLAAKVGAPMLAIPLAKKC
jgi:hypothetical protein